MNEIDKMYENILVELYIKQNNEAKRITKRDNFEYPGFYEWKEKRESHLKLSTGAD